MAVLPAFTALTLLFLLKHAAPATISDVDKWNSYFLQNYTRNVRPIYNHASAVQVFVFMYIKSIQVFDEVNEKFSYTAALSIFWQDFRMKWDPSDYGSLEEATVSYSDVWVPELILTTPADKTMSIGSESDRVRFKNDGLAQWFPAGLIESTCSVSAKNYPFDSQSCTTTFASLGYKNYEVNLTAGSSKVLFDVYSLNALWDVVGSSVKVIQLGSGGQSEILFTINLKRKSSYVMLTVVLPILLLNVLNVFVFILPAESGERIGYCITTLLAIAVYMTIVGSVLPQTPSPVPRISYKLMIDMFQSACIVVVTILNMRIFHKDNNETVPRCLQSVFGCFSCSRCRQSSIRPQTLKEKKNEAQKESWVENIMWKDINIMIDRISFSFFVLFSFISFTLFIIITKSGD